MSPKKTDKLVLSTQKNITQLDLRKIKIPMQYHFMYTWMTVTKSGMNTVGITNHSLVRFKAHSQRGTLHCAHGQEPVAGEVICSEENPIAVVFLSGQSINSSTSHHYKHRLAHHH